MRIGWAMKDVAYANIGVSVNWPPPKTVRKSSCDMNLPTAVLLHSITFNTRTLTNTIIKTTLKQENSNCDLWFLTNARRQPPALVPVQLLFAPAPSYGSVISE